MRWPYQPKAADFQPGSIVTEPGKAVQPIYEPRFDGKTTHLVQVGTKDLQEDINAHEPYTDIAYMLNRLSHGDTSVLAKQPACYGDFTSLPSNPTDIINYVTNAQAQFDTLSAQDRAKYNNDWRVWADTTWRTAANPRPVNQSAAIPFDPKSAQSEVTTV
nr:virion structural protein [Microvirus sp.]